MLGKREIPPLWKEATVILIPKPGKQPKLENLRPISLTSCVGKLMEHIIQTRISNYMEEKEKWPDEMYGFRPHLSTQDVMLRLQQDIINSRTKDAKVIMGLDLKRAFDNVKHEAILEGLQQAGIGLKTYRYVRNFLTDRTAVITFQEIQSGVIRLGNRGTPQGSVLSPTLFNMAMRGLPKELRKIGNYNLNYSLYADDINLWINRGSDAEINETLQAAADVISKYAADRGLKCSPEKSEIFVYNDKALRNKPPSDPQVYVEGREIPKVETIRILGLHLQTHGRNTITIKKLENHATQTLNLIRRVSRNGGGLKEKNLLRLVQAFIISRVGYATPYLNLKADERRKIDALIRKCVKKALGSQHVHRRSSYWP